MNNKSIEINNPKDMIKYKFTKVDLPNVTGNNTYYYRGCKISNLTRKWDVYPRWKFWATINGQEFSWVCQARKDCALDIDRRFKELKGV